MWLLFIIVVIGAIVIIYNIDKNQMLKTQVDRHGGMIKKYQILVDGLLSFPNAQITKVTRSEIRIKINSDISSMTFVIIETFNKMVVRWNGMLGMYGAHKKEWSYPPVYPQEKILNDVQKYLDWLMLDIFGEQYICEQKDSNPQEDFSINSTKNKILETNTFNQVKELSPAEVFNLCKNASRIFPVNYVEEFDIDQNFDIEQALDHGFGGLYKNCRRFTALMFCCSIANSKKLLKEKLSSYNFDDPYFKSFIELVLDEARKLKSPGMHEDISGGFDGEDYIISDVPEFKCMDYMYKASHLIMFAAKPEITDQLKNLAYNYYVIPGDLTYRDYERAHLDDDNKAKELNDLIGEASRIILPEIIF